MMMQLAKSLRGPHRDHHPLGKIRSNLQAAHEINYEIVIVPDRNDQADQWTRCLGSCRSKPR